MAVRGQQKKAPENKEKKQAPQPMKVDTFEIMRVKEWDDGGLTADLKINGVEIYGVRYVCIGDENNRREFLSFPQRKDKDGKYWHICRAVLSEYDTEKIIEAIFAKSNEK